MHGVADRKNPGAGVRRSLYNGLLFGLILAVLFVGLRLTQRPMDSATIGFGIYAFLASSTYLGVAAYLTNWRTLRWFYSYGLLPRPAKFADFLLYSAKAGILRQIGSGLSCTAGAA